MKEVRRHVHKEPGIKVVCQNCKSDDPKTPSAPKLLYDSPNTNTEPAAKAVAAAHERRNNKHETILIVALLHSRI